VIHPAGLGTPRLHVRSITSTNDRARELAHDGAPHGTLVTADEQTVGRGRQGRTWSAPAGQTLLMSLVLRNPGPLVSLAAGVAVAAVAGPQAQVKWPNDVLLPGGLKVAGILVESRPQEGWAVLGIGLNVALRVGDLPPDLRGRAGTMGRATEQIEPTLAALLSELAGWLAAPPDVVLDAWRSRDALHGRPVEWPGGRGTAAGVDAGGRLKVALDGGGEARLDGGEVHIAGPGDTGP
jgi:BirA family biotin operon repressor/biotin-[acetyl-CoA-carboxylase] ligase